MAKKLNIDLKKANTSFVFDEDNNLVNIDSAGDEKTAKLKHLESFCNKLGIQVSECVCVGDGANDIEMFRATQHGITFEDSPIKEEAWKVVPDISGLKDIL